MSESDEAKPIVTNKNETEEFARMFANFMRNSFAMTNTDATNNQPNPPPPPPEIVVDTKSLDIGYKLNNENYSLWVVLMERAISGRGMISHITGPPSPPSKTDPAFARWQQADDCVFTWLVQNIEPKLVSRISKHATTRDVWKSLAVTYSSGGDRIQVYDLRRRASTLKQKGETLEEIWTQLGELWLAIDKKSPNPMKYQEDVEIYDNCTQEDRVYQLLTALDDKYENTKREILKMEPFPSLDEAYATIRREDARMSVLQPSSYNEEKNSLQGVGAGLAVRTRPPQSQRSGGGGGGNGWNRRTDEDRSKMVCSVCGRKKHTKETCFEVVGFPEWWEAKYGRPPPPGSSKGGQPAPGRGGGRAAVTVAGDGAPAAIGGNTEAASTRGNSGDRRSTEEMNGGGIARANMASRVNEEAAQSKAPQGKLRIDAILQSNPSNFHKPYIAPHCLPPDPQFMQTLRTDPNSFRNLSQDPICQKENDVELISCKNSFEILGNLSTACAVSCCEERNDRWIFDCGATDTMTYDASDITEPTKPGKTYIQTASGEVSTVEGAGTVNISSTLKLSNCLYVVSIT